MGCGCGGSLSSNPKGFSNKRSRYALVDKGGVTVDPTNIPASLKFDSSVAAARALKNYPQKTIVIISE